MNREVKSSLKSFVVELIVYAALVFGYFFLVLKFLEGWLYHIFKDERRLYAVLALGLIVCQGIVLEVLTRGLLALIKPRMENS